MGLGNYGSSDSFEVTVGTMEAEDINNLKISGIADSYVYGTDVAYMVISSLSVKTAAGATIDNSNFNVSTSGSDKVGSAKVYITAQSEDYTGSYVKTVNITAKPMGTAYVEYW